MYSSAHSKCDVIPVSGTKTSHIFKEYIFLAVLEFELRALPVDPILLFLLPSQLE
jgi:hypothetical protein